MKLQIRTIDLDKNVCKHILSPREGSNAVNVAILLASRLSCWTFLTIEGRIWIGKPISFGYQKKDLQICPKPHTAYFDQRMACASVHSAYS